MQGEDIVRKLTEDKEEGLLVSFLGHAAYYKVPNDDAIKERLIASQENKQEICFEYDRNLTILKIN